MSLPTCPTCLHPAHEGGSCTVDEYPSTPEEPSYPCGCLHHTPEPDPEAEFGLEWNDEEDCHVP